VPSGTGTPLLYILDKNHSLSLVARRNFEDLKIMRVIMGDSRVTGWGKRQRKNKEFEGFIECHIPSS
jgi:hypothetical protein